MWSLIISQHFSKMNKNLILPLSFEVAYDTLEEIAMSRKKEKRVRKILQILEKNGLGNSRLFKELREEVKGVYEEQKRNSLTEKAWSVKVNLY